MGVSFVAVFQIALVVPLWAHAPGQAAAAFAYLHGVPPRHKAAFHQGLSRHLVPEMTGGMNPMKPLVDWKRGFWNHGVYIYIYIKYDNMQQVIHIQFYTLVAWKFATSMGILISLLVGFLIVIPIMAYDHPTLPHSSCVWIIPRGWKQVPFLASQGIRGDQWEQCHSLGVGILIDLWVNLSYTYLEPLFDLRMIGVKGPSFGGLFEVFQM